MNIKLIDFGIKNSGVELPFAAHYNDAGCDVRTVEDFEVLGHSVTKVSLGFGLEIPNGYMGLILPRSGLNSKGVTVLFSPIDSGYRGCLYANVYNTTDNVVTFSAGDKIGQLVIIPCVITNYVWELGNERGEGGFGSTGLN